MSVTPSSTCLVPVWLDGTYRVRCSMGTAGVCARHGEHKPHPVDGRACDPNPHDDYCHTHGVYMAPDVVEEATPVSDLMRDLRHVLDELIPRRVMTKVEVHPRTLDALRRNVQADPRRSNPSVLDLGVPVFVNDEVSPGDARVSWSDVAVEVIGSAPRYRVHVALGGVWHPVAILDGTLDDTPGVTGC